MNVCMGASEPVEKKFLITAYHRDTAVRGIPVIPDEVITINPYIDAYIEVKGTITEITRWSVTLRASQEYRVILPPEIAEKYRDMLKAGAKIRVAILRPGEVYIKSEHTEEKRPANASETTRKPRRRGWTTRMKREDVRYQ